MVTVSFIIPQVTQSMLLLLACHQVKIMCICEINHFHCKHILNSSKLNVCIWDSYLKHQAKFYYYILNSFTNWRKHFKKTTVIFLYSCFRHINVISSAMSYIDHLKLDKSEDRLQRSSMYLTIKLIHNFDTNQKPFLVSAVQNVSWQFSGSFSAIYFQINTQLLRGRFTPLPIFEMKLWTRAITLSQGKPLSINSWCYQKPIQTLY